MDSNYNENETPRSEPPANLTESQSSNSTTTKRKIGAESFLASADEILEQFIESIGVAIPRPNSTEADRLLNLTSEERRRMTPEECLDAEYTLLNYVVYISMMCDRLYAKASFAKDTLRRTVAKLSDRYEGYTYQEREIKTIANDDNARLLDRARAELEMKKNALYNHCKWVADIARNFNSLAHNKNRRHV